jgi:hypothetical protein
MYAKVSQSHLSYTSFVVYILWRSTIQVSVGLRKVPFAQSLRIFDFWLEKIQIGNRLLTKLLSHPGAALGRTRTNGIRAATPAAPDLLRTNGLVAVAPTVPERSHAYD